MLDYTSCKLLVFLDTKDRAARMYRKLVCSHYHRSQHYNYQERRMFRPTYQLPLKQHSYHTQDKKMDQVSILCMVNCRMSYFYSKKC